MKMNILVIDDNATHQQAARQLLGTEHNLTVVGTHDEARELLGERRDEEKYKTLKAEYISQQMSSWDAHCKADRESALPYWDAVLSDLLMPAGRAAQGPKGLAYVGQEMPVGWSLAITAALNGAKYVAVVTDMNHHNHPASAMLDGMSDKVFLLNGAWTLFTNNPSGVGIEGTQGTCTECGGEGKKHRDNRSTYECYRCNGSGTAYAKHGKNWAEVLAKLCEQASSVRGLDEGDTGIGCGI